MNRLLALVVLIVCGLSASANHVLGGNITWNCLGGDQYQVTFTLYKDCYGNAGDPATETVFFYPTGCAAVPFSADFNFVSAIQISDLCATELVNSSCSGGLNPGTMAVTYTGTVTLDAGCTWEAIWNNGDWNYFQNMDNFDGLGFPLDAYIQSVINTNLPCQNSTDITYTVADPQIPYFCFGTNTCHQLQVSNPNGYALSYTLGACQTTGATINSPINAPGYTTPAGMSITAGGLICWPVPGPSFGTYSVCVEIEMYDGLDYVGTMYESMAVVVRNCAPTTTVFTGPSVQTIGNETMLINGTTVEVCAGDSLYFTVEATNADLFRSIDLTFTGGPPGLTLTQIGNSSNPVVGAFSLPTTAAMVNASPYVLQVTATDDACPNPDTDVLNITINIQPNVELTFTDTTICEGTNITLQAFGLPNVANYNWTNVSGDNTPPVTDGQATQSVTPDQTSVYSVTAPGIPASCQSSDQVTVNVVLSDITEVVTNESCGNNNGAINITIVGPGSGNYNILWNGGGSVDQVQDQTNLLGGNYDVTIEDLVYGCVITDSFVVDDNPPPTVTMTPSDTTICAGQSVTLLLHFTEAPGTFDYVITPLPAGMDITDVGDAYAFTFIPASSTLYTISSVTDQNNCNSLVNVTANVEVRPVITGDFIQESAVCGGTNVTINIDYDNPFVGPYIIGYSIDGGATIQTPLAINDLGVVFSDIPDAPSTIYDIEYIQYTDAPFCPSTDPLNPPMTINVNPEPTATISGGATVCEDAVLNLPLVFTGTGPWTVSYTINNFAQAAIPNLNAGAVISVNTANPGTFNYCITAVTDANCSNTDNSSLNSCTSVVVAPYPTVTFNISDTQLCEGDCANLEVDVTCAGSTEFCVSFTDTPEGTTIPDTDICNQPIGAQFNYQICPLADSTDYTIGGVYCNNAPSCITNLAETITVYVNEDISVVATDTICNNTSTQYQVVYTMSGGTQPYDVAPGLGIGVGNPVNPINQTTYTTALVNSMTDGSWTFSDINDCNSVVMTMTDYQCPVITQPCDMSNTALQLCGAVQATGTCVTASVPDFNDDEMWVLCTDDDNLLDVLGSIILTNNNSPQFLFNDVDLDYNTTYYIVSIAGNGDGAGGVNLATPEPYIEVSDGQPVTWYETPTATLTALNNDSTACVGENVTLSINFTGTGPWSYTYSINTIVQPGPPATSTDPFNFTVTTAGLYEIETVTSGPNSFCAGTASGDINVIINPLPTAVWSASADTCAGIDYCFTINFTAGTSPWDATIDNPIGPDTPLNNVTQNYQYCVGDEGNYDIVTITDANGCVSTANFAPVTLTIDELPVVVWTEDDELFCQGSSVDLEIDFTAGESPYSVNLTSPDPGITNPQTGVLDGDTFTVDVEGNYLINSVTDNNGCVSAAGDAIFVDQINTPVANAGPDQEQCVGEDVTIGITPPVAGVTYEWAGAPNDDIVGSNTTSEVTVNSATAGTSTYTVTVTTDIGNCTATNDVLVTYYAYPVIDITADTDSLCDGGCANLTASGADAFLWENFNGAVGPFNLATLQVCPDTTDFFIVTGTDIYVGASCSATDSIQIFMGDALAVVEDFTAEVCFGSCDGEIELEVSGGFEPYTITGDLTELVTDSLCPGTYNYTITDAIGCQIIGGSIFIEEREPEFIDQIIITNPVCSYDLGSIQVIDNTTSIHVEAVLCGYDETEDGPDALFINLSPCEYIISTIFPVGDGYCTTDSTVSVEFDSPDIFFNALWTEDTFCYNEDACFEGVAAGGVGGLNEEWYYDVELTQLASTDNPYCVPITEDLTLYGVAIDQLQCYSDTVEVIAHIFPAITLDLEAGADTTFVCEYSCAELNAVVGGGNGFVTVEWFELPFDNAVVSTDPDFEVCPFFDTDYVVIASDGCSQPLTDTVTVHVWDTPEVIFVVDTLEGCFPLTVTFIDQTLPIADNVTCEWGFGEGTTLGICDTVQFVYNLPQLYAEYYPSLTITTENGCIGTDTLIDPIIVHGYPEVDFTWEPQPVTVLQHEVQFTNLTEGADEYLWNFFRMETTPEVNPFYDFPIVDQGVFPICLTATSEYGCADTLCQDIFMESILQVFVPNTFTPDEDGINDFWLPVVTGEIPGSYKCWVFNKWGDPMFYTEDSRMAWTGGSDGGEYYVTNDTFVWRIEVQALRDGRIEVFEGHVTMAR
ncbi:MAG: gliding motility-associated C-terminal domain-containing protein [Flavobacteriales bacterium]